MAGPGSMLQFLKNQIKTSHVFWRYRHLVDPGVWQSYHADHATERRRFYADYMQRKRLRSVFEFGCASGPNLQSIIDNLDAGTMQAAEPNDRHTAPLIVVGYDINRKAIKMAQEHLAAETRLFVDKLDEGQLAAFLSRNGANQFGLAIYDRVLYLLDAGAVDAHFKMLASLFEHVVIDDFHHAGDVRTNGAYFTKDYVTLLDERGFELVVDEVSEHPAREPFFEENARRLIFQKRRGPDLS